MTERDLLRDRFSGMLETAQTAADEYHRLAGATPDPTTRSELQRLARDEYRHMDLAQRLLEIVEE